MVSWKIPAEGVSMGVVLHFERDVFTVLGEKRLFRGVQCQQRPEPTLRAADDVEAAGSESVKARAWSEGEILLQLRLQGLEIRAHGLLVDAGRPRSVRRAAHDRSRRSISQSRSIPALNL